MRACLSIPRSTSAINLSPWTCDLVETFYICTRMLLVYIHDDYVCICNVGVHKGHLHCGASTHRRNERRERERGKMRMPEDIFSHGGLRRWHSWLTAAHRQSHIQIFINVGHMEMCNTMLSDHLEDPNIPKFHQKPPENLKFIKTSVFVISINVIPKYMYLWMLVTWKFVIHDRLTFRGSQNSKIS